MEATDIRPLVTASRPVSTTARRWQLRQFVRRVGPLAVFGLVYTAAISLLAITAPLLGLPDPAAQDYNALAQIPAAGHWLGTDHLGQDVLSRILHGARASLTAGLISVAIALVLGVPIGLISGYYGGWIDQVLMRLVDVVQSFPALLLALAITAALGPGLTNAMAAIGIVFTPQIARLVRGQTLSVKRRDYVEAARAIGVPDARLLIRHVWPNVHTPIIVQSTFQIAIAIGIEASLSFLGLGVQPPTPSWGAMLRAGYPYLEDAPWMALAPGGAIFVTILALNFLGDGLRDALDPRLKAR